MYIVYKVELPSLVGQMGVDPTGARIHLGRYRTRGEPLTITSPMQFKSKIMVKLYNDQRKGGQSLRD